MNKLLSSRKGLIIGGVCLAVLAGLLLTGTLVSKQSGLRWASDDDVLAAAFGAQPNDGKDDSQAIRDALLFAKANGKHRLLFAAGRYDLVQGVNYGDGESRYIFVDGFTGFTLQGAADYRGNPLTKLVRFNPCLNGVELTPTLAVSGGTNITLKNPYFYSAGQVVEKGSDYVVVEVLAGHPLIDGMAAYGVTRYNLADRRILFPSGSDSGAVWHTVAGGDGRRMRLNSSSVANATQGGDGLYWFFGNTEVAQTRIDGADNVTLQNLKVLNGTGFVFWIGNGRNLTVRNVRIVPEGNRIAVSPRDGMKIMRESGTVLIDGLYIEGTNDDAQNTHGTWMYVASRYGDKRLVFQEMRWGNGPLRAGSQMGFWDGTAMAFKATIAAVVGINAKDGYVVDFSETLPDWIESGVMVTAYDLVPSSYTIRNSTFKNISGSAVVNRSENVLIEDNIFINILRPAIMLSAEINAFSESTPSTHVEVRGNTFDNVGVTTNGFNGDPDAISLDVSGASGPYMSDIKIHDNTFENLPVWGIFVHDAQDVWIWNNTFGSLPVHKQILVDSDSARNVYLTAPEVNSVLPTPTH